MSTRFAAAVLAASMTLIVGGVNGNPDQSVYGGAFWPNGTNDNGDLADTNGVDLDGNGMGNLVGGPIVTEDLNGNGVLDEGEDIDNDGVLD